MQSRERTRSAGSPRPRRPFKKKAKCAGGERRAAPSAARALLQTVTIGGGSVTSTHSRERRYRMRCLPIGSLAFAAAMSLATMAHAHIALKYPAARHDQLKTGPCGAANDSRGDTATTL